MISFDEAVELVRAAAVPIGVEKVAIADAGGRILAHPVVAAIDSPRADVSAMDGYAVRDADLQSFPAALQLIGESFAGAGWKGRVEPGTCVRIFTGAPIPEGADRVVIQENVERAGDEARFAHPTGPARHIRRRGGDFRTGDVLLPVHRKLDYRAIVAAAGADIAELDLFARPRIAILGTGDELAEPGAAAARPDAIPESVSFGVAWLAEQWGGVVASRQRLPDDLALMSEAAATACASADLIVVTGGASVGEKDFAKAMFGAGLELIFSKVAIKPGKPVWLGRCGNTLVMGLPGNPSSALVTARLLLAPLICGLTGRAIEEALSWRLAPLASAIGECGSRETFHRACRTDQGVQPLSNQDSSAQKALTEADLLVRHRANAPATAVGSAVEVLDF